MECVIRHAGQVAEVEIRGDIDTSWSSYLSDRLDEVVRAGVGEVRLDLSGVFYLCSSGIALLLKYHKQMQRIGGRFLIVSNSEDVGRILGLSGVARLLLGEGQGLAAGGTASVLKAPSRTIESETLALQVYGRPDSAPLERLARIGDPLKLRRGGYEPADLMTRKASPNAVALGLGALGAGFEACRDRFGECLAVGGMAAYLPGKGLGPRLPDFQQAAGDFVPDVQWLYGLSFETRAEPVVVRFEAKGESERAAVTLDELAAAGVKLAGERAGAVGLVIVAETAGLVGAALRRSPVVRDEPQDLFAHPQVREWLSLTPDPEHDRQSAIVAGVATRRAGPALAPFVRSVGGPGSVRMPDLQGHFHAAIVPYHPLSLGPVEMAATVREMLTPGRVTAVLHLIGDTRPIVGAGQSLFTRGALWVVPLNDDGVAEDIAG